MTQSTTVPYRERLAETLPALEERIETAVSRAGRERVSVRLIAVTKSHPVEAVEAALQAGLTDLGENRVSELESKVHHFGCDTVTWHMIGHVQSRKASRVTAVADVVHSLDSTKLAGKLSRAAVDEGRTLHALVQVNTSGEEAKYGLSTAEAEDRVAEMAELGGLRIVGLMTMAPFVDDEAVLSRAFRRLRELSERLRSGGVGLGAELSMGMTNDLDIAIREGSTMVRIGTALFGERPGNQP